MNKNKILIVDDIEKNIQAIANSISDEYDIEYANDGIAALDWLKEERFDLILLDVMMPGIDGFEICRKIRQNTDLIHMPIIFLTAKTDESSIIQGFDAGGQDYVHKPFNIKELKARIKTHIDLYNSKNKLNNINHWLEEKVEKKTHQLKIANKELQSLSFAKDDFLLLLSHELRTPLNGILGFSDILKQYIQDKDLLFYLKQIENSSGRLLELSRMAFLISSLKIKKHRLHYEEINILSLINEIINNSNTKLLEKSVHIETHPNINNTSIIADKGLIKECFSQIIENAIDNSSKNSYIHIFFSQRNEYLVITFKDFGKGFSKEALTQIYKPFGLGEKHIDQNTGLGLYLVKLIVDAHDSKIQIGNNSNEKGAYVTLTFKTEKQEKRRRFDFRKRRIKTPNYE